MGSLCVCVYLSKHGVYVFVWGSPVCCSRFHKWQLKMSWTLPSSLSLCRGLTDESEILKFLQHGTLVGLLPVPHPILIRKYQANSGTAMWFRTYMWGVIYLR